MILTLLHHCLYLFVQVPAIEHLEKSMFKQYQKYAEQFVKRRQQDIKDEAADALRGMQSKSSVKRRKVRSGSCYKCIDRPLYLWTNDMLCFKFVYWMVRIDTNIWSPNFPELHKLNLVFHYIFLNFVEFMKRYPNMRSPCCEAPPFVYWMVRIDTNIWSPNFPELRLLVFLQTWLTAVHNFHFMLYCGMLWCTRALLNHIIYWFVKFFYSTYPVDFDRRSLCLVTI